MESITVNFFSIKIQKCQFKVKLLFQFIPREFLFVEINIYARNWGKLQ